MPRFGVKDVMDVTFYNLVTGEPELFLDCLKMSNMENASEQVYATGGKGAPRLVGWDFGRTTTFALQDALLNPKSIAMQSGTKLEKKKEFIHKREFLVAEDAGTGTEVKITLLKEPIASTVKVYKSEDGYEHGEKVTVTASDINGNVIELSATDLPIGETVLVYYQYQTTEDSEVITISSDKFGGYYKIVGDSLWRNERTGEDELVQVIIPKAKIISGFSFQMQPDGDPAVFDMNIDVFKDSNSTDMVKFVRYKE